MAGIYDIPGLNPLPPDPLEEMEWPPKEWGEAEQSMQPAAPFEGTQQVYPDEFEEEFQRRIAAPPPGAVTDPDMELPPEPEDPTLGEDAFQSALRQGVPGGPDLALSPDTADLGQQLGVMPQVAPEMGQQLIDADTVLSAPRPTAELVREYGEPVADPALEDMSQEALTIQDFEQEKARQEHVNALREKELAESEGVRLENESIFKQSMAKAKAESNEIQREIRELAERDIDNDRWWNSRSTGQKLSAYLSAAIGGFLQVRGHGRDNTVELLMGAVDQDIATQKANLMQQRGSLQDRMGLVSDLYQRTGDIHEAAELARLAALESMDARLAMEAQKFNPEGTQAMAVEKIRRNVQAQRQAQALQAEELQRKRHAEDAELRIANNADIRAGKQLLLDARSKGLQLDPRTGQWKKIRGTGGGGKKLPPEYFGQVYGVKVPHAMTTKEFAQFVAMKGKVQKLTGTPEDATKTAKLEADLEKAQAEAREATPGKAGSRLAVYDPNSSDALAMKDKSVFEARTPEAAEALSKVMIDVSNLQRGADLLKVLRESGGGASATVGSKEYQELVAIVTDLDLEAGVRYNLGALSKDDIKNIEKARGSKDITSFIYDPTHGIEAMAKRAVEKVGQNLKGAGYDGEKWKPDRMYKAESLERPTPKLVETIVNPVSKADFRTKEGKEAALQRAETDVGILVKHRNPSRAQMTDVARKLDQFVNTGRITQEDAMRLVAPMYDAYQERAKKRETTERWKQQSEGGAPVTRETSDGPTFIPYDVRYREILAGDDRKAEGDI